MSQRYLELAPSNKTTNGKYSFKNGVAQISWDIPEGNYLLDPSSLRIAGSVQLFQDTAGTAPTADGNLSLSSRLGVYGCFSQLIFKSLKHQTTISHERNWNRWLASYLALSSTTEDALGHMGLTALTNSNYNLERVSVAEKSVPNRFCVHLPCGLLNAGLPLNLMPNALGGLTLTIMLESDAMALQVLPRDSSTKPNLATYTEAMYELSDMKLLLSVITPPPDQLSKLMKQSSGAMTFQSIHSYYDTANSTNIQLAMNLRLKKVKSLYTNWITSNKLNNLSEDSFATLPPSNVDGSLAAVEKVAWLRGGSVYPRLYSYDTNIKNETKSIAADPILMRDFVNSVVSFDKGRHMQISPTNDNRRIVASPNGKGVDYRFVNDGGVVWGLGVNYENYLGGSGIDMSQAQLGLSVDCKLTSSNAQSIFLFVNAETQLVYNANGVQVIN
tara:strand:- start:1885 stop:3213 length:1329 start_codon:yes stop_codon:yes gene_type:complete